ncbi:MAG: hypothetical protein ABIS50_03685 [Luteolibacter sp.]|uniref:hypothetical protein n=1 Tax=Luteolibacter sp. TaxID=1962973 RepID=UPI00326575B9
MKKKYSNGPAIALAVVAGLIALGVIIASQFPERHAGWLFLFCSLGLITAVVASYYLLGRFAPRLDTALEESQYERFKRLEGLFRSIPLEVRESPERRAAADEFRAVQGELREMTDENGNFTSGCAPDLVHNLHLLYLQIAPIDFISFQMLPMRQEFRDAVGPAAFEAYAAALGHEQQKYVSDPSALVLLARADATFLTNETRRQWLLKTHVEVTRQKLLQGAFRSWWWAAVPLIATLVVYLFCQDAVEQALQARSKAANNPPSSQNAAPAAPENAGVPEITKAVGSEEAISGAGGTLPTSGEKTAVNPEGKAVSDATEDKKGQVLAAKEHWMITFAQRYLLVDFGGGTQTKGNVTKAIYTSAFHTVIIGTMLSLIAMAGATGGMLSVIQRVQSVIGDVNANANVDLRTLSQCGTAVFFAPINGALFALILSIIFAGGFIASPLFPTVNEGDIWYFTLWNTSQMPKWLLWGFIAGFSERLVPDMLNTFTKQALDESAKGQAIVPPATIRTTDGPKLGNAEQGADRVAEPPPLPVPSLNVHAGAIPADASEVTVTGSGLSSRSQVSVNGHAMDAAAILESNEGSLRLRLEPADLLGRESLDISVTNPPPGGGTSETIAIPISGAFGG